MKKPPRYGFFTNYLKEVFSYTGYSVASTLAGYMTYQAGVAVSDTVYKKLGWNNPPPPKPTEDDVNSNSNSPK